MSLFETSNNNEEKNNNDSACTSNEHTQMIVLVMMSSFTCYSPLEHIEHYAKTETMAQSRAISTFSPVGSLSSNGVRIRVLVHSTGIVRNELMHGYANVVHTSN